MRVLVIGAGTGGLALAHGLRREGIDVRVYERDRTRSDGLHGYRVGIDPDGSRALRALLPPDLFDTFVATCARPPRYFSMLTEGYRELLSLDVPPMPDPVESEKSVSRMTLRQVLLTGLEDVVEFGREFVRYEEGAEGVTAFFADGTSATGDLLVAADGSNSRVRAQRLPDARVEPVGIVAIAAKLPLDERSRPLLPAKVHDGISMVLAPRGMTCVLHVMEFPWDAEARPREGIGTADRELLRAWPGLLFDNTRDYVNWGLAGARRLFPPDVMRLRGEALVRLALDLTPHWHEDLRELFRLSDRGSVFPVEIATSVPVEAWEPGRVTLLGDAIHTMTPGRGVGANTALRDAHLLTRRLAAVRAGRLGPVEAVAGYEERMREYGFDAVRRSRAQMTSDAVVHRPVVGRVALAGMRTALRVVNHTPPLRRRMAASMLRYRGAEREESPVPV